MGEYNERMAQWRASNEMGEVRVGVDFGAPNSTARVVLSVDGENVGESRSTKREVEFKLEYLCTPVKPTLVVATSCPKCGCMCVAKPDASMLCEPCTLDTATIPYSSQRPDVRVGQVWRYVGWCTQDHGHLWTVESVDGEVFMATCPTSRLSPLALDRHQFENYFKLVTDCPRDPPVEVGQVWEIAGVRCEVIERDLGSIHETHVDVVPSVPYRAGQVRRTPAGEFTMLTRTECREHWTRLRAAPPAVSEYVSGPTTDRDEVVWLLTQAMGERTDPRWRTEVSRLMGTLEHECATLDANDWAANVELVPAALQRIRDTGSFTAAK